MKSEEPDDQETKQWREHFFNVVEKYRIEDDKLQLRQLAADTLHICKSTVDPLSIDYAKIKQIVEKQ